MKERHPIDILRRVIRVGFTRLFMVGDSHQSIFGFAGADSSITLQFASEIDARSDVSFLANFRSSPSVVDAAENLFKRGMQPRGALQLRWPERVQHLQVDDAFQGITDYFLPAATALGIPNGQCAVLAPTWFALFPLGKRLRNYSVPILGPGSRPYKRRNPFAEVAEQLCLTIEADSGSLHKLEKHLFLTVSDICGFPAFQVYTYDGRRLIFELVDRVRRIRKNVNGQAVLWLEQSAFEVGQLLSLNSWIPAHQAAIFSNSVQQMLVEMRKNGVDLANLSTEDLGMFGSEENSLRLMTMHSAKGSEFTAVALIDVHQGRLPHAYDNTPSKLAEAKRLFYVSVTRAKRLLMIFTDKSVVGNVPSQFVRELRL